MRPSKLFTYMNMAEAMAERSHDSETKVGGILINEMGAVVASSHNGFVRGVDDTALPTTRPNKYEYMVHCEENLIANCARYGIRTDNCTLICTLSPCVKCMRLLWQSGIKNVVFKTAYKDYEDIKRMGDIHLGAFRVTDEGFYKLEYVAK